MEEDEVENVIEVLAARLSIVTGYNIAIIATRDKSASAELLNDYSTCWAVTADDHGDVVEAASTLVDVAAELLADHNCKCPSCTEYAGALKTARDALDSLTEPVAARTLN